MKRAIFSSSMQYLRFAIVKEIFRVVGSIHNDEDVPHRKSAPLDLLQMQGSVYIQRYVLLRRLGAHAFLAASAIQFPQCSFAS
jgi:hypothetical protein